MAFTVTIDLKRSFELAASYKKVFQLLSNVPQSAAHFPKIAQLVDLGDNVYRWEHQKIGVKQYAIQTRYACRYSADKEKGVISWKPVKGEGNAQLKGKWTIKALKAGPVRVRLVSTGTLEVPLPRLVKALVAPIVLHEFESLVDCYVQNLNTALSTKE